MNTTKTLVDTTFSRATERSTKIY